MHDIKFSSISYVLLVVNELFVFKRKLVSLRRLPLESIEQKHTFYTSPHETSLPSISNTKVIHSLSLLQTNFYVSRQKSTSTTNHYIRICPFILVSDSQLSPRHLSQTSVIFYLSLSLSLSLALCVSISISSV